MRYIKKGPTIGENFPDAEFFVLETGGHVPADGGRASDRTLVAKIVTALATMLRSQD